MNVDGFAGVANIYSVENVNSNERVDSAVKESVKTNWQTKFYQQALYHYFQGDYSTALNIISVSKSRLGMLDQTSLLFEAGLQVNIGLYEQAKQTLLSFDSSHQENEVKSNELLVLALLSLTEQFLAQNELLQAQQTLAKISGKTISGDTISGVTSRYYQQYYVLSQLAYWPNKPIVQPLLLVNDNINEQSTDFQGNNAVYQSPYIQFNNALRYIEANDFIPAISLLTMLKSKAWQAPEQTFWQTLFTLGKELTPETKTDELIQNQAINDYSRLLLAQVYAHQEAYDKVFVELKTFPQHSSYTEQALFLFAFSAQKVKQHTIALNLLSLLHQQYPYSYLGWQAGLLMGKQATEQKGLAQGWLVYQDVETFFEQSIDNLDQFEKSYLASTDLLTFSTQVKGNFELEASPYRPESVWLQQAMTDASIKSLYQQLTELTALQQEMYTVQHKSEWIAETIKLNTQRKSRIARSQYAISHQWDYEKLFEQRNRLSERLMSALSESQQIGDVFANKEEQLLLDRINRSNKILANIKSYNNDSVLTNVDDYQQRLARLSGVLAWQLKQQYPQRAWQHKQQLLALDNTLKDLETLQSKIHLLAKRASAGENEHSLLQFTKQLAKQDNKISPLSKQLSQLKTKVSLKTRLKVTHYIKAQRRVLMQHLLATRKAMAAVLEQMSINDKKIENQPNIDALGDASDEGVMDQQMKEQAL